MNGGLAVFLPGAGALVDSERVLVTIAELARQYGVDRKLLQFAAENAGTEVNYRAFIERSSWSDVKVRSELGAVSKVARKLFGSKVWPVRTRQGSDGVMRYFMPPAIAELWRKGGSSERTT